MPDTPDRVRLEFIGGPVDGYTTCCRPESIGLVVNQSLLIHRSGHAYMSEPWDGVRNVVRLGHAGRTVRAG